ncbi:hypothetical protein GCM10020220_113080 [Nonomuraea rubra]
MLRLVHVVVPDVGGGEGSGLAGPGAVVRMLALAGWLRWYGASLYMKWRCSALAALPLIARVL